MKVERWGWYSVGINVILVAINLSIATASGSLAVAAEMVHNVVDFIAAVGVLIGLKLATRKTRAFPYGLYKLENVTSVVIAAMIFVTAYEIVKGAMSGGARETVVNPWMIVGIVLAAAIPLIFSRLEMRAGQEANSPALIADAKEYSVHGLTSGMALLALIGQSAGLAIDRIAALLIVVVIAKTGWDLLSDGMRVLLDASLSPDMLLEVRQIIEAEPAVGELRWVTGRNAGRFRFIEAELALRVQDLSKAERVTRQIEERIRKQVPMVERVLIHAEPMQRTHLRIAAPLSDDRHTLSEHFGEAPYFGLAVVRLADRAVIEEQTLENPFRESSKAKGIQVAEWLAQRQVDALLLKEDLKGKGPEYVFRDASTEMMLTDQTSLDEAIVWALDRWAGPKAG